tara:strand:- start:52265 stop:53509 length:1245 start_codon:yes stop_codon:yes gene_type:complete
MNLKYIIDKINVFGFGILVILPVFFVIGTSIADIGISFLSLIFLLNLKRENFNKYIINPYFISFFILCLYFIVLSLISDDPFFSLQSSLFYIRFIFFSLCVWLLIDKYFDYFKYFTYVLLFLYCFILIDSYFQYFVGFNILGYEYNGNRLSGIFGDEYILGSFLSRMMPILFASCLLTFNKNDKFIYFLSFLLISTDVLIYISGERLAFFYITFITLLFIFLVSRWKLIRLTTFIISLFIILYISFTNADIKKRMIDDTIKQSNILEDQKFIFTSEHQALYDNAIDIYKDNIVLGIGPKMFRIYCDYPEYKKRFGCSTHPHNTYLQLLVETGLIGFLFFISIFLLISYYFAYHLYSIYFLRKSYFSDYQIFLFIAVFISLWPFSPTSNFFGSSISIIYYLPVGFLLNSFYKEKK